MIMPNHNGGGSNQPSVAQLKLQENMSVDIGLKLGNGRQNDSFLNKLDFRDRKKSTIAPTGATSGHQLLTND